MPIDWGTELRKMNGLVLIAILLIEIIFSGCASPTRALELRDSSSKIRISSKYDEFKKITTFSGEDTSGSKSQHLSLRAIKADGTNQVLYQVYAMSSYTDQWRFYESAWDTNGTSLELIKISRQVGNCNRYDCGHMEHIGINVSRAYLERASSSEFRFKLSGRGGEDIFTMPGFYIKDFLDAVK